MDDWLRRSRELAAAAGRLTEIRIYVVVEPLLPLGDVPKQGSRAAIGAAQAAHHPMHCPDLLATPETVAGRLSPRAFALWTSAADALWCASTLWDSIAFPIGRPVAVDWIELLPAKGAGITHLRVGPWSVHSGDRCRAVRDAAADLARFAGVDVKHLRDYST